MNETPELPFPRIAAAGFAPKDPLGPTFEAAHLSADSPKRSVVVRVNPELLARFRDHCAQNRCSVTDAVLTAHLELGEAAQQQLQPTRDDEERISLGLPPRSTSDRLGPGDPLSLWITPQALDRLDRAAAETRTTRRRYVTTLLQTLLADAERPAAAT